MRAERATPPPAATPRLGLSERRAAFPRFSLPDFPSFSLADAYGVSGSREARIRSAYARTACTISSRSAATRSQGTLRRSTVTSLV